MNERTMTLAEFTHLIQSKKRLFVIKGLSYIEVLYRSRNIARSTQLIDSQEVISKLIDLDSKEVLYDISKNEILVGEE